MMLSVFLRPSLRYVVLTIAAGAACATTACGSRSQRANTKKSDNRIELAKDFLTRNQLVAARREAQKAIAFHAGSAEAYAILGLVDFLSGVNNFRLLEVDDCLTGPDAADLQRQMDEFFLSAQSTFAKATELDSEYGEAFGNHAAAAAQTKDFAAAIELNEKALMVPHRLLNVGLTRANLGWARFHAGDLSRAAADLRQSLQFNPEMCVATYRLGRIYYERKEWAKALELFQSVVEQESCPLQEANLYFIRSMGKLGMTDALAGAVAECTAIAPRSCVAAECRGELQ